MIGTTVKTYKDAKTFSRDAARMAQRGYQVVSTHQEPSKNKPLRNLLKALVGGTMLWGSSIKGGKIVVTYQLGLQPARPGMLGSWSQGSVAPMRRSLGARLRRAFLVTVGVLLGVPLAVDVLAHLAR
jgi:hypothetical protein